MRPHEPLQARAVIVEGQFDAALVHALTDVLAPARYKLEVVTAAGVANLAALAGAADSVGLNGEIVVIAHGDGYPDTSGAG